MKRTRWYPPEIAPARPGVYETRVQPGWIRGRYTVFCMWDGECWHMPCNNVEAAQSAAHHATIQSRYWRGVKKQSN